MLAEILRFELHHQLRQPIFLLAGAFFFLTAFLAVTTDAVVIGGSMGNVDRNAPFVILRLLLVMSIIGIYATTAFLANAVLRDQESGTQELFFSTPIRKRDYLLGRFAGAFLVALAVFAPVVLGMLLGSLMPWLDPERVGPFRVGPYLQALAIFVVPNLLFTGSIQFALAILTRSLVATYAAVIGMFVAFGIAGSLLSDIENERLAAMLDPFGGGALDIATRYWTVAERNSMLLPLKGDLLANRLVVLALADLAFAFAYARFSLGVSERRGGWRWRWGRGRKPADTGEREASDAAETAGLTLPKLPAVSPHPALAISSLRQFVRRTRMEIAGVVLSTGFLVIGCGSSSSAAESVSAAARQEAIGSVTAW